MTRLARFVLWTQDGVKPRAKMIAVPDASYTRLNDIRWLNELSTGTDSQSRAENAGVDMHLWDLTRGQWSAEADGVAQGISRPIVLLRLNGVTKCVDFGMELELLYQCVSFDITPRQDVQLSAWDGLLTTRIVWWPVDGIAPVVIRVPRGDSVVLADVRAIAAGMVTDVQSGVVDVWDLPGGEWSMKSIFRELARGGNASILVKRIDVGITPGLGQELARLEEAARVRDLQGVKPVQARDEEDKSSAHSKKEKLDDRAVILSNGSALRPVKQEDGVVSARLPKVREDAPAGGSLPGLDRPLRRRLNVVVWIIACFGITTLTRYWQGPDDLAKTRWASAKKQRTGGSVDTGASGAGGSVVNAGTSGGSVRPARRPGLGRVIRREMAKRGMAHRAGPVDPEQVIDLTVDSDEETADAAKP
ncbi:hypothetical protein OH77DRAFT_1436008 [Trametes cingulata]|nr:hypothetical protein OH77DRAFT_1436008 [Trametes cingulata]